MKHYESWGRYPKPENQTVVAVPWHGEGWAFEKIPVLPFGQGRSYGDSCLNNDGLLLDTEVLDHFIAFDDKTGLLRCEAGITLATILDVIVPRGWFLPVTPGTKFVSIGGAIANDIHGKNHHKDGTFGCHVLQFELLHSDGSRFVCSSTENNDLFRATIGGLGLTGLITWAEIQLIPIRGPWMEVETIRFRNLKEFFDIEKESETGFQYTVAWVDSLAQGAHLGRGLFMRGNHSENPAFARHRNGIVMSVPCDAPNLLLNTLTIKAFNYLYLHKQGERLTRRLTHYDPFFYPLDAVGDWNRLYGRRGFLQYQCVVEDAADHKAITSLLEKISRSGLASFLTVLKRFGTLPSPGMLSFPKPGLTLALDFPFQGDKTLRLLETLDTIVREEGGSVYPAKDARMSAASFQSFYPKWQEFARYKDPKFSSSFWRRVTG